MWALLHRALARPAAPPVGGVPSRRARLPVPLHCHFQLHNGHVVRLTRRQLVLLTGITAGQSNRQIGRGMQLSEKTIKNYVSILYDELGIREHVDGDPGMTRRVRAAVLAATERMVPPYDDR